MTLHILRREGGDAKVAKMQNCKIAKKCRIAEFIGTHALLCAPLGWAIASQVPEITNAFQNYNKYSFHIDQIQNCGIHWHTPL